MTRDSQIEAAMLAYAQMRLDNYAEDLRAKVEALPERGISMTWDHPEGCALVWRAEVLALIDGADQ